MEIETARWIEIGITAGGLALWAAALGFTLRSLREPAMPDPENPERSLPLPADTLAGRVEAAGRADELAPQLIEVFARKLTGGGKFDLVERGRSHFEFTTEGGFGPRFASGRVELRPLGAERTEAFYRVRLAGAGGARVMAWLFLALGLTAIVCGAWLILTQVAVHPNPAVRKQVFQGFQIVHFLWPPFLFAGRYRRLRQFARSSIEGAIHNLRFLAAPRG